MQIVPMPYRKPNIVPGRFRRLISTTEYESKLAKARKYRYQAGMVSAIGGIVQGVVGLAQKIYQGRVVSEYSDAVAGTTEDFYNLKVQYLEERDYKEMMTRYDDASSEIHQKYLEQMRTQEAKEQYSDWFKVENIKYKTIVQGQADWMEAEHAKYNLDVNLNKVVGAEDKNLALKLVVGALSAGHIYPHEAQAKKEEAYLAIDMRTAGRVALSLITPEGPEAAIAYLNSDQAPKDLDPGNIAELEKLVNAELKLRQAERAKELEGLRTQAQGEIVQKYSTGNVQELRKLRAEVLALDILPPVGQNSQLWWVDKIDTQIKTYLDATNKGETDPNTQFSPEIYAKMLQVVYDDSIDLATKEEMILNNMGSDAQGNPRLRAKEDIPTLLKLARAEKSFTVKTAFKSFDLALANEIITPQQYIDVVTEFNEAKQSGKYTEQGLKDFAKIQLIQLNEEWIEDELERPGGIFTRKPKPEEYIESIKPEKRPVKKELAEDFEDYFNKKVVDIHTYDDGRQAIFDGVDWWMFIDGKWHKADPKTNTWKPYKRSRK